MSLRVEWNNYREKKKQLLFRLRALSSQLTRAADHYEADDSYLPNSVGEVQSAGIEIDCLCREVHTIRALLLALQDDILLDPELQVRGTLTDTNGIYVVELTSPYGHWCIFRVYDNIADAQDLSFQAIYNMAYERARKEAERWGTELGTFVNATRFQEETPK